MQSHLRVYKRQYLEDTWPRNEQILIEHKQCHQSPPPEELIEVAKMSKNDTEQTLAKILKRLSHLTYPMVASLCR
jgi:hypothetical protein